MEFTTHHIVNPRLDGVGPMPVPEIKRKPKVDIGCLYRAALEMGMQPAAKIHPEPAVFIYDKRGRPDAYTYRSEDFIYWRVDLRRRRRKIIRTFLYTLGIISILTILNFVDFS